MKHIPILPPVYQLDGTRSITSPFDTSVSSVRWRNDAHLTGHRKDPTGRGAKLLYHVFSGVGGGGVLHFFQVLGLCQLSLIFLTPAFGFFSFQDGEGGSGHEEEDFRLDCRHREIPP